MQKLQSVYIKCVAVIMKFQQDVGNFTLNIISNF